MTTAVIDITSLVHGKKKRKPPKQASGGGKKTTKTKSDSSTPNNYKLKQVFNKNKGKVWRKKGRQNPRKEKGKKSMHGTEISVEAMLAPPPPAAQRSPTHGPTVSASRNPDPPTLPSQHSTAHVSPNLTPVYHEFKPGRHAHPSNTPSQSSSYMPKPRRPHDATVQVKVPGTLPTIYVDKIATRHARNAHRQHNTEALLAELHLTKQQRDTYRNQVKQLLRGLEGARFALRKLERDNLVLKEQLAMKRKIEVRSRHHQQHTPMPRAVVQAESRPAEQITVEPEASGPSDDESETNGYKPTSPSTIILDIPHDEPPKMPLDAEAPVST